MNNYNNKVGSCLEKYSYFPCTNKTLQSLGLDEKSTQDEIKVVARELNTEIKSLTKDHHLSFAKIWDSYSSKYNLTMKMPRSSEVFKDIRRYLTKLVKKASFKHQHENEYSDNYFYVSQQYINRDKGLRCRHFDDFLYTYSERKKQHALTSRHLTEAVGLASVSLKDGLRAYFLTITCAENSRRSSKKWNGNTADNITKNLSDSFNDLNKRARNNALSLELIRATESMADGTPHSHAVVFSDDVNKLKQLLKKSFPDNTFIIHIKKCRNVYQSILYMLKQQWDISTKIGEHHTAWLKAHDSRTYSKSSNVRRLPPSELWECLRKRRYSAKREIEALEKFKELVLRARQLPDLEIENFFSSSVDELSKAALRGDYAEFIRVYNFSTRTRRKLPTRITLDTSTIACLGTAQLDYVMQFSRNLRTISSGTRDNVDALCFLFTGIEKEEPEKQRLLRNLYKWAIWNRQKIAELEMNSI